MRLKLLEMGQTDKLSACKLSLLLGVLNPQNSVERFLRISRKLLNIEKAVISFVDEPYVWYSTQNEFKAFQASPEANLHFYFNNQKIIDSSHENYAKFSQHIVKIGVDHQRIVCFDLRKDEHTSFGHVTFFDDKDVELDRESYTFVQDIIQGLIKAIETHAEYQELKESYEQQLALNFSKTKFFQIIAHDLRAPFHGLLGFSEVLSQEHDSLDDASVKNIAEYLYDTAQSTYNLLENLLNWAMAEGGRFVYHPINFKLKQSSKIVFDVLNSLAINKNIRLIDDIPEELKVCGDINMITSVLQNLVSNALKFTHVDGTGHVRMSARSISQGVEILVQDTGLGMTEAQMQSIFEPEINASFKGTAGEKGTGLGLVLCKRFVDLNQGTISVSSKMGEGTTFKVILPEAKNHQALVTEHVEQRATQEIHPLVH